MNTSKILYRGYKIISKQEGGIWMAYVIGMNMKTLPCSSQDVATEEAKKYVDGLVGSRRRGR